MAHGTFVGSRPCTYMILPLWCNIFEQNSVSTPLAESNSGLKMGSVSTDCPATQLPAFGFENHCQRPLQIFIYLLEAPGQTEVQGPVRRSGVSTTACGHATWLRFRCVRIRDPHRKLKGSCLEPLQSNEGSSNLSFKATYKISIQYFSFNTRAPGERLCPVRGAGSPGSTQSAGKGSDQEESHCSLPPIFE